MFYVIFSFVYIAIIGIYCILNKKLKNFNHDIVDKILKICVVIYCSLSILSVLLPDSFIRSLSYEEAKNNTLKLFAILRWLNAVNVVVLPIAVFFDNKYFKNIAVYICIPITILSVCCYNVYMIGFTSNLGRGLNSIDVLSEDFKRLLINENFRTICISILWLFELCISTILAIKEKILPNFRDKKEIINSLLIFIFVFLGSLPIYVPQYLFGYTDIIFDMFTLPQVIWILSIIVEIVVIYNIFKNKDEQTKTILCLTLSLMLVCQYTQMFGAVSISAKRLPLQLCNIGSFLILAFCINKNRKIFDFAIIVNVVGVLIALILPDLDGEGIFYLWNMHFVFEHTNVLVVPILALLLKISQPLNKNTLKHFMFGYMIYFGSVWVLGTIFNTIYNITNNDFFKGVNYMFMFDSKVANDTINGIGKLFDIQIVLGKVTIYPVVSLLFFVIFGLICTMVYFAIMSIYWFKSLYKKNPTENTSC